MLSLTHTPRSYAPHRPVRRITIAAAAVTLLAGCGVQTISPELRYLMAQPIRCETAQREIALLLEIRPDGWRQTMTVANSLSPPGLAGMIVSQDFENRRRVLSGEHAADIDRRIAQIRERCGRGAG